MSSDAEKSGLPPEDDPRNVGFDPIVRRFHDLYCQRPEQTWQNTFWLGTPLIKCPLDLWIYQEILYDEASRPDVIVETGTLKGGSAHFMACILDLIGSGRVITIDNRDVEGRPQHPRITYLTGSSTAPQIVATVREQIRPEERVMVVLDSKHHRDHVLAELEAYAGLVTGGNYLIVEDTNINSWRDQVEPGPLEALREFLRENDDFEIDRSKERFMMTFAPGGYLRRKRVES
jgi:cephalosporin hydroxylase